MKVILLNCLAAGAATVAALIASAILLLVWGLISGISISFIIHQRGDAFSLRALISQLVMLGLYVVPALGAVVWFARRAKRDNPIKIGSLFIGSIHAFFHGYFFVIVSNCLLWEMSIFVFSGTVLREVDKL